MNSHRLLAILDPYETDKGRYNFKKDTSHLLLYALSRRGHRIYYTDPASLSVPPEGLQLRAHPVQVLKGDPYFEFKPEETLPADFFSMIMMRKDPPVDLTYHYITQFLSTVPSSTWVTNNPRCLRDWSEKMIIYHFPKWIPPSIVATRANEIDQAVTKMGGTAVAKELNGFSSKGVYKLDQKDPGYSATRDLATGQGKVPVMIQAFLPQIYEGEKRVTLVDGKIMASLLRVPAEGSFLANPDMGARIEPTKLTEREQTICEEVGDFLNKNDIFFAGLDLIGEKLTEINITSTGLLWEHNEVDNRNYEEVIVDLIEGKLR